LALLIADPFSGSLEAVTSRLEDLYENSSKGAPQLSSLPSTASTAVPAAVTDSVPPSATVQTKVIADPPSVVAYEEQILKGRVEPFVKLTGTFPNASVVEQVRSIPCGTRPLDHASNSAL
jgi:adenylyl cyclase-associated protein